MGAFLSNKMDDTCVQLFNSLKDTFQTQCDIEFEALLDCQ